MAKRLSALLLALVGAAQCFRLPPRASRPQAVLHASEDSADDVEAFRRRLQEQNDSELEKFRDKLNAGALEFDRVTKAQEAPGDDEWVEATADPRAGDLLIANAEEFLTNAEFRASCGVPGILPDDLPRDRIADILPVICLYNKNSLQSAGFMLNRRSGMLMGDIAEQHGMRCFQVQPIWLGGSYGEGQLTFMHDIEELESAIEIREGLYLGGSFESAQELVEDGTYSGFRFKFFLQTAAWGSGVLEEEIKKGWWLPARCSNQVILKVRERAAGALRSKPMWREILELAGGEYKDMAEDFYGEGGDFF